MGNHRAERSARVARSQATVEVAGKRRAVRRSPRFADSTFATVPVLPTVVGLTALAAAGAGSALVQQQTHEGPVDLAAAVDLSQGTNAIGFTSEDPRVVALSRDSERQAQADAADQELKAAAEQQSRQRNAKLKSLGQAAEARAAEILQNKWHLPVTGYRLTARFGMGGGLWAAGHTGLDFAAPSGSTIVAVANGVVTETGYDGSYGNKTVITLEDGTEVWFCHQTTIEVSVGDNVVGGEKIGTVGSTGNSTGPHLHLEVRPGGGDPVDPYGALTFHDVTP